MKKFGFLLFMVLFVLTSCQEKNKWEYKVLIVANEGFERSGQDAYRRANITPTESDLNKIGNEGWELVGNYLEMETAHPNFGSAEYVTGLQPNIRPQRVVLLFKRRASK